MRWRRLPATLPCARSQRYTKGADQQTARRQCNGKGENGNIQWLTGCKVSQFRRIREENQMPKDVVAPRARIKPATNRLTAEIWQLFLSVLIALYRTL